MAKVLKQTEFLLNRKEVARFSPDILLSQSLTLPIFYLLCIVMETIATLVWTHCNSMQNHSWVKGTNVSWYISFITLKRGNNTSIRLIWHVLLKMKYYKSSTPQSDCCLGHPFQHDGLNLLNKYLLNFFYWLQYFPLPRFPPCKNLLHLPFSNFYKKYKSLLCLLCLNPFNNGPIKLE